MISWIQNQFQKHFRFVFFVLLAVVIVAFVFTIGAAPGIGNADGRTLSRSFYGVNLGSSEDTNRVFGDAQLSVVLQAGYQALEEGQLQQYALQRHAGLHLAQQLNLPAPSPEQLTTFIQGQRIFAGPNGQFDAQAYSRFRDSLRTTPGAGEAMLARVLRDDYRYDQVQKLIGGPGYVLDADVEQQIARADTTWEANVATIAYTAFTPSIEPTDAELRPYFESNAFRYEQPAQVRVSYIDFPATAFADRVNLSDSDIRAFYEANPSRFPNPARAASATPAVDAESDPDADFAAVRDQVATSARLDRARQLAARAASDLTVALFEARVTAANAEQVVSSMGQTLRSGATFARGQAPAFLGGNVQAANEAFRLSAERPVSDALPTPGGAVVLVWQESVPARPSEFAEVGARVREDYVENQRRQRFAAAGRTLREALTARLTQGETFGAAVNAEAQAQGLTVEVTSHGPFPRREPPQDAPFAAINALERLEAGQVSDLIVSGDQGLIVHAASKSRPDIARDHPRFQEVRTQMAEFNAARNADALLADMVRVELARSEPPTS